ncbi:MAG: MFS transporter [Acidobacteria bacterium]|nr:MAG: MFS transporter [Acidobacteriota bacterium]
MAQRNSSRPSQICGVSLTNQRTRVFYGWWVVATAALALCLGAGPIVVFSFGVFFKPLSQDFHAGRAAISFAFTLQNLTAAVCAPFTGRLIDRFGARNVILPGTAIFGLILVSSKMLGAEIGFFYVFFAALGVVAGCTSPVAHSVVVSHWFNRHRGVALGFMMLGMGLGAIAMPVAIQRLIAVFGWRITYALCGSVVLLVALPIAAVFLRGDPKEKGLQPDGIPAAEGMARGAAPERSAEEGLSWRETWHSSTFWLLISSFFLAGASVHACVLHMPALLTDRGVSAQGAAMASSIGGIALLIGRVGTGYLLDRFFAPRLAVFFFCGASVGIGLLMFGAGGKAALVAAFLVGLGMGAEGDIIAYSLSRYFGLKAFGTAYGYAFGAFVLAGALGTLLMGAGFDSTKAYTVPLAGFFAAMLLAAWLMTRLGPYRYAAEKPHKTHGVARVQAESLG